MVIKGGLEGTMKAIGREGRWMEGRGVECGQGMIKLIDVDIVTGGTSKRRNLVARLPFIYGG